jgi:hypothetical protein
LKQCSSPELVISARSVKVPPTSVPRKLDEAIMWSLSIRVVCLVPYVPCFGEFSRYANPGRLAG